VTADPAFREHVRSGVIAAFGPAGEEAAADEAYARAVRKRDDLEASFAAALPARMQKIADLINAGGVHLPPRITEVAGVSAVHWSGILPDGMRFTFER
jgi:hypothetical protein